MRHGRTSPTMVPVSQTCAWAGAQVLPCLHRRSPSVPRLRFWKPSTNRWTTAFSSRWWSVWQLGHGQRSCHWSATFWTWQMQHNFDDGKNLSTLTSVRCPQTVRNSVPSPRPARAVRLGTTHGIDQMASCSKPQKTAHPLLGGTTVWECLLFWARQP
jgi:hypothetical protein